uniref:Caspase recruitment domain family member 10 n=1 Tax=Chelonoidis abingdonii TaxID=106734 RepID=A0A8C0G207_CHEAB
QIGKAEGNLREQADSPSQEEEEEVLWEKIESARHQLTRSLNPAKLTSYLRQCRVIDEQDEEEVLSSCRFPCKSNRTGHLMDILRCRGKRGYEAFLESLEFYYPEHFTQLTGKEPAQRCSMILDEEGPEGLTQFLMLEVKKVRAQRKEHLVREHQLKVKNQALEEEQTRLRQKLQELLKMQERCQRLREEWESNSMELLRLKDENYMLAMRYAQLCEEKNLAVLRSRDLQLVVDQLKCKVSSLEEECRLLRKHVSAGPQREAEERGQPDTVPELQAENQRLMASLQELQSMLQAANEAQVPGSQRILLDILEHDWKEAQDERQELCQKLHSMQNELQRAEELRDKYLQEVENLQLKHQTLQKDCELYKHRMNTVLSQLEEIEKERDQAIQNRDRVQLQYSQSLVEKDQYRKRVRALEEERDDLRSKFSQVEGVESTLEAQLQQCQGNRDVGTSSYPLCSNLSSIWSLSDNPYPLGNGVMDMLGVPEVTPESEKDINRLSTFPFPPCAGSILRRQREDGSVSQLSFNSTGALRGGSWEVEKEGLSSNGTSCSVSPLPPILLSLAAEGDFAEWAGVVSGKLHTGGSLPEPLYKRPRSSSNDCPLHSYLCPLEKGMGCGESHSVSLVPGYQPLKEALEKGKKVTGDSFYVRTNLTFLEQSDPCSLCFKRREILHVTDTMHRGRLEWYCARVDPLTLRDLDKGTVPNYILCPWSLPRSPQLKKRTLGQLRLVKSKSPGEPPPQLLLDPCPDPDRSPKPYSLVRPLVVEAPRPVVLSPDCIAPRLIRNLLDLPTSRLDFHLCPAATYQGEGPGPVLPFRRPRRSPRAPGFGRANKHCLLELGLQRVRDLIKSEIYPIIIHVEVTEKNVRGLRSLLRKPGQRDSDVVKLCQSAEQSLHALPCSWACVDAQSWCHAEELVKVVRLCIFQEQNKVVWVEDGELGCPSLHAVCNGSSGSF